MASQWTIVACIGLATLCGLTSAQLLVAAGPSHCPNPGLLAWPNEHECDRYTRCENGTVTDEVCPNGLLFDPHGGPYDFCNWRWKVDCGTRKAPGPIPSPDGLCGWQFDIYPSDNCVQYTKCEWGAAHRLDCEYGLAYDDRTKTCNWPDEVPHCDSEQIVGFKCPAKSEGLSARFEPYPRYLHPQDCTKLITCVNYQPRLIKCGEGTVVNPHSLTCEKIEDVGDCRQFIGKKK